MILVPYITVCPSLSLSPFAAADQDTHNVALALACLSGYLRLGVVGAGLRESIGFSEGEGAARQVSELLLVTQYFDTLEKISEGRSSTIFIPHSVGGVSDVASNIRNGILQVRSTHPCGRRTRSTGSPLPLRRPSPPTHFFSPRAHTVLGSSCSRVPVS